MLQLPQQQSLLLCKNNIKNGSQKRRMALQMLLSLTATFTVAAAWAPSSPIRNTSNRRSILSHHTATTTNVRTRMMVDPNDILQSVTGHSASTNADSLVSSTTTSTLLANSKMAILTPAHGHSQPMFGPPDPYLTSGKSIAPPSMQALKELFSNSETTSSAASGEGGVGVILDPAAATATTTTQISQELQSAIQAASTKGWNVVDAAKLQSQSLLPGFSETHGILSRHDMFMPEETAASLAQQVEWSAQFLNVVDKLPMAALVYVVVDFFFLRPTKDVMYYKEDVVDGDPTRTLGDIITATSIRVGVFSVIAILTLIIFGGGE